MNKLYFILGLFWVSCTSPTPKAEEDGLGQVKVIFTNESPSPIGRILFASSHTGNDPAYKKYMEYHNLTRPILPNKSDSLLLKSFNRGSYGFQVFFLVGSDTVKNVLLNDMPFNKFTTTGTLWYGIYYNEGGGGLIPIKYTLQTEGLNTHIPAKNDVIMPVQ